MMTKRDADPTTTTMIDPSAVSRRHDVDDAKVATIAQEMSRRGWRGRPVVVYREADGRLRNITGCHRLAAAEVAEIRAVAVVIDASDDDVLDICEYAAATDDRDAADALQDLGAVVVGLVARG